MNLRNNVTRVVEYARVIVNNDDDTFTYFVKGKTDVNTEMKRYLRKHDISKFPTITVENLKEKRTMSLENFIKNSEVVRGE